VKKKYHKYILISVIIISVLTFAYLINKIYNVTLDDAKKNHQLQQLQKAKIVAEGINYFMEHLVNDMSLLVTNSKIITNKDLILKEYINHFKDDTNKTIISSVLISDSSSHIIFFAGEDLPDWVTKQLKIIIKQLSSEVDKKKYLTSPIFPYITKDYKSEKSFLIVFPIITTDYKRSGSDKFIGFLVNFDLLIEHFIKPLELSSNDFIWILDGKGRLIYHPKHEEMLFNSIFNNDKECLSCHTSFDSQKKMLNSSIPSFGEHTIIGDEPSKIFAYVPISIAGQKWFIAISTLLPDVTESLKDKFQLFFILGVVILITFLFFIFLIYYLNMKRIKSDEIRKNLEKIQDYQEQLNHTARLASIGELVDSVAHEINTPVGIISAHADSILLQKRNSEIHTEDIDIIKKQTKRIGEYIKSLLNFSKRIAFNPENVDIKELLNESVYLLQPKFREKNIEIIKKYSDKETKIIGDKRQLEQVFINILNNAIDSMNKNGKIIIGYEEINIIKNQIHSDQLVKSIVITITDNGIGIEKENLTKIFESFYTTKEKNGTGLGLSIAKSIIQRHRGKIEVSSKPGKGTTFKVIIPNKFKLETKYEN
jgi:signal transduction histidine kinase